MLSQSRPTGVLHYETSRAGWEQPPLQEAGRAGGPRPPDEDGPGDAIPWLALGLLLLAGLISVAGSNFGDDACPIAWRGDDVAWEDETIAWPPGVRCITTLQDGRVLVQEPSWMPFPTAVGALSLAIFGLRSPRQSWRSAARVVVMPTTIGLVGWAYFVTGNEAFVGAAVALGLTAVPVGLAWALLHAFTRYSSGRIFLWSISSWIGGTLGPIAIAAIT